MGIFLIRARVYHLCNFLKDERASEPRSLQSGYASSSADPPEVAGPVVGSLS